MHPQHLNRYRFILASKSPRRQQLMRELGIPFELITKEVDESFPAHLQEGEIPLYLCRKKADAFDGELTPETLVITADTVVWINNHVLNKPESRNEAINMLRELSGSRHEVYTAVCIKSSVKQESFAARTDVWFKPLTQGEIEYYVDNYKPYDKAGAYGAQEWIGYIGMERIDGSYFNVMGLPVKELYEKLAGWE
ncbi:MAG: Maf family nucleotide pyrophosphatase [Bacteroidota bacterium]|jgi:septum formation protein